MRCLLVKMKKIHVNMNHVKSKHQLYSKVMKYTFANNKYTKCASQPMEYERFVGNKKKYKIDQ